ncbi:MAG: hypothetical protein R3B13_38905 [Polyangiaceae bacterium]
MAAVLRAFFGRERWDLTLQCAQFDLWPEEDIFHDPLHTDGGVHKSAQELLRPYLNTHSRAMVVLDQQFGGELPADKVREDILARLSQNGWQERSEVVVIDPELEVWLWQNSRHVEQALMFTGSLRQHLQNNGQWPAEAPKPLEPKETIQALVKAKKALKTKVVYSRIARSVSIQGCTDPSFELFTTAMRVWFPLGER